MNDLIFNAIKNKQRLRFRYHEKVRIAEPQCYGEGTKGNELLRTFQREGGIEQEPLFTVSKIEELEVLKENFSKPGPNYKKGDSAMKTIFIEL
jgi:hypothetical protein